MTATPSTTLPDSVCRKRLLLVDDEPAFTRLLKVGLERTGQYEVASCHDSWIALRMATELKPDAILLDIVMPGIDGGDLYRQMQQDPRLRNIPKIMLTALVGSREVSRHGYTTSGGILFIPKLVAISQIHHCLTQLFDGALRSGVGMN